MAASRSRILLFACALFIAAVVALAVSLLVIPPERIGGRTWKRHYTLLLGSGEKAEQLIRQIAESGRFQGVVSRYTSEVSFNTFDGFSSVSIQHLDERLDPLDPRFDPYMQRVGRLFTAAGGTSWELVYLRTDRNVLSTYLYLRRLLGGRGLRWRLIEFAPAATAIKLLLFLGYLGVCIRMSSSATVRTAVLLAAAPWILLVAISGYPALLASFLVMPAWVHFFGQLYDHRYVQRGYGPGVIEAFARPAAVLLAAGGLGILLNLPRAWAGLLLVMAGGGGAASFLYCFFILRDSRNAHPPFRALPILRRLRPRRAPLSPVISMHLMLCCIVAVSYPLLRFGTELLAPEPETVRMRSIGFEELSWRSLKALSDYANPGGMPDLADYLTHRAYQESLIFGRPYEFPVPGERILISEYRIDPRDGRVLKTFRVVKQFKESWLYTVLETATPGSVARLLADQGFAGTVEVARASEPLARYGFSGILVILFLIQFLVPRHINLTASILYATRNLTLRRH